MSLLGNVTTVMAGIIGFVSPRVGIRGGVRYFRNLQDSDRGSNVGLDLGGFDFWRATAGVTFRSERGASGTPRSHPLTNNHPPQPFVA